MKTNGFRLVPLYANGSSTSPSTGTEQSSLSTRVRLLEICTRVRVRISILEKSVKECYSAHMHLIRVVAPTGLKQTDDFGLE